VRLLAERFDTRPSQRGRYARVAWSDLRDPVIVAQLYEHGRDALLAEDPSLAIGLANAYRDTTRLREIVADTRVPAWARGQALGDLVRRAGMPTDEQKQHYLQLIADAPRDWSLREAYVQLLRTQHDFRAAEQVPAR
jgi:hypothetical protein